MQDIYPNNLTNIGILHREPTIEEREAYTNSIDKAISSSRRSSWQLPARLWKPHVPNPLHPMLYALQTATESYLQAQISDVEVVVPFRQTSQYVIDLSEALSALSLKTTRYLRRSDIEAWDLQCTEARNEDGVFTFSYVLAIEHTRSALTASIFEEEGCVYERRATLHAPFLGSDAAARDPVLYRERLGSALENLIRSSLAPHRPKERRDYARMQILRPDDELLPPEWPMPPRDGSLTHVLRLGESAEEQILTGVLAEVFESHYGVEKAQELHDQSLRKQDDYVFGASRAAAQKSLLEKTRPF